MNMVAFLILVLAQDAKSEDFWKLKAGATLEYDKTQPWGAVDTMKITVVKSEDDRTSVDLDETVTDREGKITRRSTKIVWLPVGDQLAWARIENGEPKPVYLLYKIGSKRGDVWSLGDTAETKRDVEHRGEVEVKTKAGTYKNAIHIKTTATKGGQNTYLVPGIGMVKMEQSDADGKIVRSTELTRFKDGK